jgi:hypothetical protein
MTPSYGLNSTQEFFSSTQLVLIERRDLPRKVGIISIDIALSIDDLRMESAHGLGTQTAILYMYWHIKNTRT